MNDVIISFTLPDRQNNQAAIKHVEVSTSIDGGATFAIVGEPVPPEGSVRVNDLANGDWIARCIVEDVDGDRGDPVDEPFVIGKEGPGTVAEVNVEIV